MEVKELTMGKLNPKIFIEEKIREIASTVESGLAINALSGGVDSSAVTMLGHRALGDRLKTYFIENGIMREGEAKQIVGWFRKLGVRVEVVDAQEKFFRGLKGLTDPEEKREAITQAFYKDVFGPLVKKSAARFLMHGTNYTDIEETVAGVKRQHNILVQLGIDTEKVYGYKVLEPLKDLRKPAVRKVAKALGLPAEIYNRPPFPGPALAARVIGEVTPDRVKTVRKATRIVEEELAGVKCFQNLAILHHDLVTGVRGGKRDFGLQVEVRCWDSEDAVTGNPTRLPYPVLEKLADRITSEVPGVVSVVYNITRKPPSTIEAV
jgi:GMP synthase (glutamine-hydrolysing)